MFRDYRLPADPDAHEPGRMESIEVIRFTLGEEPRRPTAAELDHATQILLALIETADRVESYPERFAEPPELSLLWTLSPQVDPVTHEFVWEGEWRQPEVPIVPNIDQSIENTETDPDRLPPPEEDLHPATPAELGLWMSLRRTLRRAEGLWFCS